MRRVALLVLVVLMAGGIELAKAQESFLDRFDFYGDFRGRIELDRDSDRSNGTMRSDRDRLRMRGRFGLNYNHSDLIQLGWRLRTGDPASRQSPHVTLGDDFSAKPFSLDKLFARVQFDGAWVWFGKNGNPFWHQNEMFWDDDVTLDGLAGSARIFSGDNISVDGRAGYFILDSPQSNSISDQAKMVGGQLVLSGSSGELAYTAAASMTSIRENPDAEDVRLADMDYNIVSGSVQVSYSGASWPIRVGADIASNTESYDDEMFNHDQTAAYVFSVQAGGLSSPGDVLFRYTFAYVEKFAVVGPFAQDDWVRWGSSTTTMSSNFGGHEFRAAYALGSGHNLVARLYTVEGLELESEDAAALQTGTRFRLDWNISF